MQSYAYLITLLVSLGGLAWLDHKFKLAWFWDRHRTIVILISSLVFFLVWDIGLITADIVSTNQAWVTGLHIVSPDMPVEELLFLTLLSYQTLLLWRWQCTR